MELRSALNEIRTVETGSVLWILPWLPLALVELGRAVEARTILAEVEAAINARDPGSLQCILAQSFITLAYDRLGDNQKVAASYRRLERYSGVFLPMFIDHALGLAAWHSGDTKTASRHLESAEAQARRAGARPNLALILLHRGHLEHRQTAATEGLRLCDELHMLTLGHRIVAGPNRAGRPAVPAGLTARELEVLRLVAQGRTNRQDRR